MKKLTLLFMLPALAGLMMACGGKTDSSQSASTSDSETSQESASQSASTSDSETSQETTSQETTSKETTSQETTSQETTSQDTSSEEDSSSEDEPKTQTYNFYIDYSHSDSAFYTMMWWNGRPLGSCPTECQLTDKDAPDEAYPIFLGWSKFSSAQDESQLWDFSKDASLNRTVSLYGIWVSE